jgi:hypothetical protein
VILGTHRLPHLPGHCRGTMPVSSSSPIDPAVGHLVGLAEETADDPPSLLAVLARVTDPQEFAPRGRQPTP